MNSKKNESVLAPVMDPITYPAVMLAAFLYMWCAGEIYLALIQSVIGAAGIGYGLASR